MAIRWKEGDLTKILDRPVTPRDAKTGLYFTHFKNIRGTIFKLYPARDANQTAQAAIDVDIDSLPDETRHRHLQERDRMVLQMNGGKRKRAVEGEEEFRLRYVALVAVEDLVRPPRSVRG